MCCVELGARLGGDVAGGDQHRAHAARARLLGDVDGELGPDDRIVVGHRHRRAALRDGEVDHLGGRDLGRRDVVEPRLGDVPVLAELAAEVAAGGAEREDLRAGEKVVERLLLDGIDGEAGGAAVAERDQLAAFVLADEAEAGLPVAEPTVARAERAEELAARLLVPPTCGMHRLQVGLAARDAQAARGSLDGVRRVATATRLPSMATMRSGRAGST